MRCCSRTTPECSVWRMKNSGDKTVFLQVLNDLLGFTEPPPPPPTHTVVISKQMFVSNSMSVLPVSLQMFSRGMWLPEALWCFLFLYLRNQDWLCLHQKCVCDDGKTLPSICVGETDGCVMEKCPLWTTSGAETLTLRGSGSLSAEKSVVDLKVGVCVKPNDLHLFNNASHFAESSKQESFLLLCGCQTLGVNICCCFSCCWNISDSISWS